MIQGAHSEPESLRDLAHRLLREHRAKKDQRAFCDLVERCERERTPLQLTQADLDWLRDLRIRT